MALSTDRIKQADPKPKPYELFDSDGLVVRVLPSGAKSWCVLYHDRGRKRRATVGRWPSMGLRAARSERDRIKAQAAGHDAISLSDFAEQEYLPHVRQHKRSAGLDERVLRKDVLPELGDRPVVQITRRECVAVLDRVQERGATEMAVRTYALLRRLLQLAVERGLIDSNPARGLPSRKGAPRDRVLGTAELAAWWPALLRTATDAPRIALALVLATGQRPGEVLEMAPEDLDPIDEQWMIPAAKAKNGIAHTVPLTGWAQSLLSEAKRLWPDSDPVIPVSADTVRTYMRQAVEAARLQRATPHDLRRTVATWLGRLGYTRQIQDRILNHKDRTVGAIYDRYSYDVEKRAALEAWAAKFNEIVAEAT